MTLPDEAFDRGALGDEEWAVTPEPGDLEPESAARERLGDRFRGQLDGCAAAVVTHTDADGLGAAALICDYHGPDVAVAPVDYDGPYGAGRALGDFAELAPSDAPLYLCDFNPGPEGPPDELAEAAGGRPAVWFDHHQWPAGSAKLASDAGVEVVLDDEECATSLVLDELGEHGTGAEPADFDDYLADLAEVTRDLDLWVLDDERSEDLSMLARELPPLDYIDAVLGDGAAAVGEHEELLAEARERFEEREARAVANAHSERVSGLDAAVAYCPGGRRNRVGNELVEGEPDHSVAVVLGSTGSASVYSHSDEGPMICDEVARGQGGGGHPTAAGFRLDFDGFRSLADYWGSAGLTKYPDALGAVQEVARR